MLEWVAIKTIIYVYHRNTSDCDIMLHPSAGDYVVGGFEKFLTFDGSLPSDHLATIITSPKRLFLLASHSDGISTSLASSALCTRASIAQSPRLQTIIGPSCFFTDYCERLKIPVTEAEQAGRLLSPAVVSADVFLNFVCWGLRTGESVDVSLSLGVQLLLSERMRCMLTSVDSISVTEGTTFRVLYALWSGLSLGECLTSLNEHATEYLLFGDPTYKPCDATACVGVAQEQKPVPTESCAASPLVRRHNVQADAPLISRPAEGDLFSGEPRYVADLPIGAFICRDKNGWFMASRQLGAAQESCPKVSYTQINRIHRRMVRMIAGLEFTKCYLSSVYAAGRSLQQDRVENLLRSISENIDYVHSIRMAIEARSGLISWTGWGRALEGLVEDKIRKLSEGITDFYLEYACNVGSIMIHHWTKYFRLSGNNRKCVNCWCCGELIMPQIWMHVLYGRKMQRRLDSCWQCGIVYDGPVVCPGKVRSSPQIVRKGVENRVVLRQASGVTNVWGVALEVSPRVYSLKMGVTDNKISHGLTYVLRDGPRGTAVQIIAAMSDGALVVWRTPVFVE